MELVVQLALAVMAFGLTLSGGSLVWPKVTSVPRPEALEKVYDIVVKTPLGTKAAQVLGAEQINFGQVATTAWNEIKDAAQKRTQTILMSQITAQLMNKYEKLPADQKKILQEIICNSSPSGVVK